MFVLAATLLKMQHFLLTYNYLPRPKKIIFISMDFNLATKISRSFEISTIDTINCKHFFAH